MAEERVQRRLAAVLAADIVGYSRLIEADEEGTRTRVRTLYAELIDPGITADGGRVVKTMGDGILVEFPSAVDAVRNALRVQSAMRRRNADLSEEHRLEFRVGINIGDVIVEDEDIHGDGVNVAARLEALCEPGQVYVSATVRDHVTGKLKAAFDDLGEKAVKNIARPIRIFRARLDSETSDRTGSDRAPAPRDKPAIAVLPFDNMSGDPEQAYFADGISEDIITDLSKVSGLFVIARNTSFAYRGKSSDLRLVCNDLGVRYVLEGSVRKAGHRVRINAQMIDGSTGGHVWADRYDRDLEDIFAVQDEVTREIVGALQVALTAGEQTRRAGRRKVDPDAYDLMVRGRELLFQFNARALAEGRALLERAIAIDPDMAAAHAALSLLHSTEHFNRWNGAGPDHLTKALEIADRACRIDPDEPRAFHALALANLWLRRLDAAEGAADRAVRLNPNFAGGFSALGHVRDFMGNHASAIECAEKTLALDPHYDIGLQLMGRAQFALGRDGKAVESFERRLVRRPRSDMTRAFLAAIHGHAGRREEARRRWREMLEINPDFSLAHLRAVLPYESPAVIDRLANGLRAAGLDV